jgi:hypothetical protein
VGVQNPNKFDQFVSFLETLEVYGSDYQQDIHPKYYKERETQSHRGAAIKKLKDIIQIYNVAIFQMLGPVFKIS